MIGQGEKERSCKIRKIRNFEKYLLWQFSDNTVILFKEMDTVRENSRLTEIFFSPSWWLLLREKI